MRPAGSFSLGCRFLLAFYEEVELEEFLERFMKQIDNELSNISKNQLHQQYIDLATAKSEAPIDIFIT